jgi:hypothetical protein
LTTAAFAQKIASAWLQEKCPIDYTPQNLMSWSQDPTAIASLLAQILNTANIPYYITDGVAATASPEDVIISKLVWRRESQSDKQWRDILGILKVQQEKLDFVYLREWVARFELDADWQRAKVEAGVSDLDLGDI